MDTSKQAAGFTAGPKAVRQGTWQETEAGPWIVSHEGVPVIKRELRFAEDGAPAGWELLGGDSDNLARDAAASPALYAALEQIRKMTGALPSKPSQLGNLACQINTIAATALSLADARGEG